MLHSPHPIENRMSNLKIEFTKLAPTIKTDDFWCAETNTRSKITIHHPSTPEFMKARNTLFQKQYKLPMKYLCPKDKNKYVCQKSPTIADKNNIESAFVVIEPLNIGFDAYIKYIPINQSIPLGTIFRIDVGIPYEALKRKFIRSKSLKTSYKHPEGHLLMDPNIHIGSIDIGSRYTGTFEVTEVPINNTDSFHKFSFECEPDHFSVIVYDFIYDFQDPVQIMKQLLHEANVHEFDEVFN